MVEEPAGAAPGLAVLYGFLFLCDSTAHSYRDWSRGARRGRPAEVRILNKGAQGERGQWPIPLPAQAVGLAKGGPPPIALLPTGLFPTTCDRGRGRGLLHLITALTHHPSTADPHSKARTRNGTMSPEEQLKELGAFSLGKMGWHQETGPAFYVVEVAPT